MTWVIRTLAVFTSYTAALAVWAFATGAHEAFAWTSWVTVIFMLAASVLSLVHTLLTKKHVEALAVMQRLALARFNYTGDHTEPVRVLPACGSCGAEVTGYTGRYDAFKRSMVLTESNTPCGCIIHHVRFFGRVTASAPQTRAEAYDSSEADSGE
jgi:hypothetical protein